jgi:hypothetical protein
MFEGLEDFLTALETLNNGETLVSARNRDVGNAAQALLILRRLVRQT